MSAWKLWLLAVGAVAGAWLFASVPVSYLHALVLFVLTVAVVLFGVALALDAFIRRALARKDGAA